MNCKNVSLFGVRFFLYCCRCVQIKVWACAWQIIILGYLIIGFSLKIEDMIMKKTNFITFLTTGTAVLFAVSFEAFAQSANAAMDEIAILREDLKIL